MSARRRIPARNLALFLSAPLLVAVIDADAQQSSPAASASAERAAKWQLAPIRWGGALGLAYQLRDFEDQPRSRQTTEELTLEAASYIWQPWFLQIAGGLGLFLSQERQDPINGTASRSANSQGTTGRFELGLFPVSRFPFTANFDVSDSRTSGDLVGADYRSTRLGLRQNYRSLGGTSSYAATFDHSVLKSDSFGRDRVDVLTGTANYSWPRHQLQINANYSENDRSDDELGARYGRLSLLHNYRPAQTLSVDSMASVNRDERRFGAGESGQSVFNLRQITSFLNWRGAADSPLTVVASARLSDASTQSGASDSSSRSAALNTSASYRFNPNLNTFASFGATVFDAGAQRRTLTTQSAGAQYQIDPRRWGRVSYNAQAGLSAANQTGGNEGAQQVGSLTAGHQVATTLGSGATAWSFSLGQNGALVEDSFAGASRSIAHTASASWRYSGDQGLAAFAGVTLGDSRTFGRNAGDFQLLNVQMSGQWRPGQFSSFNANLTWQATRQTSVNEPDRREQRNLSGTASYQHGRVFGVPRLRYTAQFSAYDNQVDSRLQGDPNALRDQASWALEQRLEYLIGRLESRLIVRVAEIDGKENASLYVSVTRRFGF